jgi:hypothetical protein
MRARIAGKSSAARDRVTFPPLLFLSGLACRAADWKIMVNGASCVVPPRSIPNGRCAIERSRVEPGFDYRVLGHPDAGRQALCARLDIDGVRIEVRGRRAAG